MSKNNRPPAFLLYVDDFSSDGKVEAMTTEEVGAYILLLCKSWREDPPGSIPNDDAVLARWARLTPDRWAVCRAGVLAAFTFGTDSRWHQKRLRQEYDSFQEKRKSAKRSAETRWNKERCERNANAVRTQCSSYSSSSSNKEKPKEGAPAQAPSPFITPEAFTGEHLCVYQTQDRILFEAFPWVDRQAEYRKIDSWLEANPKRRPKRASRFLHNWFARIEAPSSRRSVEACIGTGPVSSVGVKPEYLEKVRRIAKMPV